MATDSALPAAGGAAASLGLGDQLGQQVAGETDEQRKRRLAQLQQAQLLGPAGSMAATTLLGLGGGAKSAGY